MLVVTIFWLMSTYYIFRPTSVESSFCSMPMRVFAIDVSRDNFLVASAMIFFFVVDIGQDYFMVETIFHSMLTRVLLVNVGW